MVKSRARAGRSRLKKTKPKTAASERNRIVVLGIGGAGNSAVNRLTDAGFTNAEYIAVNTDLQQLDTAQTPQKILIGEKVTRGLGSSGDPRVGRAAIEESKQMIEDLLKDVEVVFLVCGLGGGTGTGAAPVVAEIARRQDIVSVGVVTTPLRHEKEKMVYASFALNEMRRVCDTVVVIDSNKFMDSVSNLPMNEAFKMADQVSADTIKSIIESISSPGLINLDFADFKSIVQKGGVAFVTMGESDAPGRAEEAVRNAFRSPLFDEDLAGATGALVQISGDKQMKIEEANHVGSIVSGILGHDAIVKWGARSSLNSDGFLKVTLVMTGFQPPKILSGFGVLMPKLYDIESSYSEQEKQLQIDLGLDQIENFED